MQLKLNEKVLLTAKGHYAFSTERKPGAIGKHFNSFLKGEYHHVPVTQPSHPLRLPHRPASVRCRTQSQYRHPPRQRVERESGLANLRPARLRPLVCTSWSWRSCIRTSACPRAWRALRKGRCCSSLTRRNDHAAQGDAQGPERTWFRAYSFSGVSLSGPVESKSRASSHLAHALFASASVRGGA